MKFNWGTGIFVFYCVFATSLFLQVYQSTKYDRSLVADDYYAKDIAYQEMYDKKQNSLSLEEAVTFRFDNAEKQLKIQFPEAVGQPGGDVILYRPKTKKDDLHIPLRTNEEGAMLIPIDRIPSGSWIVQVDWKAEGKEYYDEYNLFIPNPS